MPCNRPIQLKDFKFLVPCGKCEACTKKRITDWSTRIIHESFTAGNSVFITLTYDEAHLPINMSLNKNDVVNWIRRFKYGIGRKIKYYIVGEYGEKYGRPHYHALLFNISYKDFELVDEFQQIYKHESWEKGLINVQPLNIKTARYVVGYINKDEPILFKHLYPEREEKFSLMSKGIGKSYALQNELQIRNNMNITINGSNVGIPRYYRKILEIEGDEVYKKYLDGDFYNKMVEHYKRIEKETGVNNSLKEHYRIRNQREINKKMYNKSKNVRSAF